MTQTATIEAAELPRGAPYAAVAKRVDTPNNFDLLRLAASLQVVYFHATHHLRVEPGDLVRSLNKVLDFFPGVPIFFVISGFLISKSYERASSVRSYARNRALRIYPALWVSFAVSLALLGALGALSAGLVATPAFGAWILAQITFGQVYNPGFLRGFGVGVLNGSLWTIPVELGFYVLLPLVYAVLDRLPRRAGDVFLGALALASYTSGHAALSHPGHDTVFSLKLLLVSPIPYFYMFLFGVLLNRHFERLRRLFEGKLLVWLTAYIGMMLLADALLGSDRKTSYPLALLANATLAGVAMSFAFTRRTLSERVLRGNDISYGLYIYHMLVVNLLVHLGAVGGWRHVLLAFAGGIAMATLSWLLVESPALKLKSSPPRPLAAHAAAATAPLGSVDRPSGTP